MGERGKSFIHTETRIIHGNQAYSFRVSGFLKTKKKKLALFSSQAVQVLFSHRLRSFKITVTTSLLNHHLFSYKSASPCFRGDESKDRTGLGPKP